MLVRWYILLISVLGTALQAEQLIELSVLSKRVTHRSAPYTWLAQYPEEIKNAIEQADMKRLRGLLEAGANPNMIIDEIETPLSVAITNHSERAVQLLLDFGANPARIIPGHLHTQKNSYEFADDFITIMKNVLGFQNRYAQAKAIRDVLEYFWLRQTPEFLEAQWKEAQENLGELQATAQKENETIF